MKTIFGITVSFFTISLKDKDLESHEVLGAAFNFYLGFLRTRKEEEVAVLHLVKFVLYLSPCQSPFGHEGL